MDTTIRNLDDHAYRALRARAVLEGRTVGDLMNDAIRQYLGASGAQGPRGSLRALRPERVPTGSKRLSAEVDAVVYGRRG